MKNDLPVTFDAFDAVRLYLLHCTGPLMQNKVDKARCYVRVLLAPASLPYQTWCDQVSCSDVDNESAYVRIPGAGLRCEPTMTWIRRARLSREQSRAEQGRARVEGLRDVDSQRLLAWLPREQGVTTGIVGHYRPPDGK